MVNGCLFVLRLFSSVEPIVDHSVSLFFSLLCSRHHHSMKCRMHKITRYETRMRIRSRRSPIQALSLFSYMEGFFPFHIFSSCNMQRLTEASIRFDAVACTFFTLSHTLPTRSYSFSLFCYFIYAQSSSACTKNLHVRVNKITSVLFICWHVHRAKT